MSSDDYVDELTKEEFEEIYKHKNSMFKTGTTVFFGIGNDINYVIPISEWESIVKFKPNIGYKEFHCYYYKEYDFIVVTDNEFKNWKLATETACILIKKSDEYKTWFKNKAHRKSYFSAFLYV